ncbi:MAG: ATP-binding protein [Spirochaetia bacterium]|nr:ATP-binding protein [Spirochaetia bacterium]
MRDLKNLNQVLFNNFDAIILLIDKNFNIIDANKKFCNLIHKNKNDLLGKTIDEISTSNAIGYLKTKLIQVFKTKQSLSYQESAGGRFYEIKIALVEDEKNDKAYILGNEITKFIQLETQLSFQIELEKLILKISSDFINIEVKDIKNKIHESLTKILEFSSFQCLFLYKKTSLSNEFYLYSECCRRDICLFSKEYKKIDIHKYTFIKKNLREMKNFQISEKDKKISDVEKNFLRKNKFDNIFFVPLVVNKNIHGFLGFAEKKGVNGILQKKDYALLYVIGQIISKAFEKEEAEKNLKEIKTIAHEAEERLGTIIEGLSKTNEGICVIDENYLIQFSNAVINRKMKKAKSRLCYEALMQKEEPCEFCLKDDVLKKKKSVRYDAIALNGMTYDIISVPLNLRGSISMVNIFHDVTEKVKYQKETESLSRKIIDIEEKNTAAIAMEIHDDFGQSLALLKMNLQHLLEKNIQNIDISQFNQILKEIDKLALKVSGIAKKLSPIGYKNLGLERAIMQLTGQIAAKKGISVETKIQGIDLLFSERWENNIYRIIQESLTNVLKHSNASKVKILLKHEEDKFLLNIEDNGRGIHKTQSEKKLISSGMGLYIMKERAKIAGCNLDISSNKNKGTKISVIIPQRKI